MSKRETMAVELRAVGRLLLRGTRRAARTLIGFALVLLGLAGLVLPVLPGWVFIIAGFAVLAREYAWARSALEFARRQAVRSQDGVRSLIRRRRGCDDVVIPSDDIAIDLTGIPVAESGRTA
jgi:hypothetical protein